MTITRFIGVEVKDEYAGDDEKSKQIREELFQKHVAFCKSRPYITNVQVSYGHQGPLGPPYSYGLLVDFESEEKLAYYADVDQDHKEFKVYGRPLCKTLVVWAFTAL